MTATPGPRRLTSIDLLRTLAIVLMTVVHFVENLAGSWSVTAGPMIGASRYWWLPTGLAAPLFTFLAGVSYRLWADDQRAAGRSDESICKMSVRRGLFLILFGLAFNVLVWLPEDVFNWDILTLVGAALLLLAAVRRTSAVVPAVACGLIVMLAPTLRALAGYADFWNSGYYEYDFTLGDVVLGCVATGFFPLFPWLAMPLAGFLAAPLIYGRDGGRSPRAAWIAGGLLVAAAATTIAIHPLTPAALRPGARPWTMFPATTAYVLGTAGGAVLLATALHLVVDRSGARPGPLLGTAEAMSRHSLSLYVLHHVAHVWPLWLAGWLTDGDPTALWQVATPVSTAVAWAVAFLLGAAWLAPRLDRSGVPSAEKLLRWLCEP